MQERAPGPPPGSSTAESHDRRYEFSREAQDEFAIESIKRARKAIDDGRFDNEIEPVRFTERKAEITVGVDEQPHRADLQKIPHLRPAFQADGTVTAANSSSISDGAAALVMMRESEAERRQLTPRARVLGHHTYANEPGLFTTAPIYAIRGLLEKIDITADAIDLYEINEAFAVVTMATMRDLNLPHERVNVHGGACALGHPIGASGARIMATLISAMQFYGKSLGVASLCIGGGEATAIALQKCD